MILIDMTHTADLMPHEPILFEVGIAKTLRLTSAERGFKMITDADTHQTKQLPALLFTVIEEDGAIVDKELSVIQKRLIALLDPFLQSGDLFKYPVKITKLGTGFVAAQWTVELIRTTA